MLPWWRSFRPRRDRLAGSRDAPDQPRWKSERGVSVHVEGTAFNFHENTPFEVLKESSMFMVTAREPSLQGLMTAGTHAINGSLRGSHMLCDGLRGGMRRCSYH